MEYTIKVYVQVDSDKVITDINSSVFLNDTTGWTQIDEGAGDKYSHAQSSFLVKGLVDSNGKFNYKLVDGKPIELTTEEKERLFPTPAPQLTELEVLRQNQALMQKALDDLLLGGDL